MSPAPPPASSAPARERHRRHGACPRRPGMGPSVAPCDPATVGQRTAEPNRRERPPGRAVSQPRGIARTASTGDDGRGAVSRHQEPRRTSSSPMYPPAKCGRPRWSMHGQRDGRTPLSAQRRRAIGHPPRSQTTVCGRASPCRRGVYIAAISGRPFEPRRPPWAPPFVASVVCHIGSRKFSPIRARRGSAATPAA